MEKLWGGFFMRQGSIFFLATVLCLPSFVYGQEKGALVQVQTISVPGLQGGFNHMSVDAGHQRLYAAAPSSGTVEIIDLNSGKPWRTLKGERPAAVRYAPEFNQLYVTQGQSVVVYDGKTLNEITSIDLQSTLAGC
jgi:DNA-binding beta-propeller fold protein YncE